MPRLMFSDDTKLVVQENRVHTPSLDDIVHFSRTRLGFDPDGKQAEVLRSTTKRGILNCCRQWGKTTVIAAKVVHRVYTRPGSLVVVASPTLRQSNEWMLRAEGMLRSLGLRIKRDGFNKISAVLPNGSRIVGLPDVPRNVRGFAGLSMLVVDEAAFVGEEMFHALTPMLATTDGEMWLMSTPWTKSGQFYDTWQNGGPEWDRFRVPAHECPRISPEFLARELASKGRSVFDREYACEFLGHGDSAFERELIDAALHDWVDAYDLASLKQAPNWITTHAGQRFIVALDLGKKRDYAAFCKSWAMNFTFTASSASHSERLTRPSSKWRGKSSSRPSSGAAARSSSTAPASANRLWTCSSARSLAAA